MADRPNFFELLDLDPQRSNWPEIEARVKEKKGAWAKESTMGSPKKRQEAKRNLDLLPEILRVLQDPALRRQEAEDALRRRDAARQIQERKLAEWIELLKGSGSCSAEQLGKICGQFEGVFSEQDIRARFSAAGIRVEAGPAGPKPPRERTDSVTAKDIRQNLELLGLSSLYELLDLPPDSPAETLRTRAEEILKEIHRLGRTDVETAARSRLAGSCMTVFQNEEEKKKYDNHRLLEAVEAIEEQIRAAADDGVLSAQEIETLIRLAAQRGASPDEVREVLEERAAREGWKVERASAGPSPSPAPAPGGPASQGSTGSEGEPPPAPARMIVRPISGGLRLSWEPVRLPGVRYRVLRKAGSVPWDEGDGLLVTQTGDAQADDAAVPPAVSWYYAVFSLKDGLASSVPAHSGPHLVPADGAAESSRNLGKMPVRKLAAAGLVVMALGGGAAAYWWAPLASLLPKPSPSHVAQKTPQPTPQPVPQPAPQPSPVSQPSPTPAPTPVSTPTSPPVPLQKQGQQTQPINQASVGPHSSAVGGDSAHIQPAPVPTPAPLPLPLPAKPEVAVIAVGDPLLASPLEDELEKALGGEGIGVVSGSPALDSLRRHRASSPTISEILTSLRADGIHAAVIAQVERGGDRELSYFGRRDVSSSSRVKIFAYLVNGRRALSPGWSEQIEYTTVNASTEGENAAHRASSDLATAVRNGWGSLRGASQPTP
jgi:bacterioferritin-associated ferredoxin